MKTTPIFSSKPWCYAKNFWDTSWLVHRKILKSMGHTRSAQVHKPAQHSQKPRLGLQSMRCNGVLILKYFRQLSPRFRAHGFHFRDPLLLSPAFAATFAVFRRKVLLLIMVVTKTYTCSLSRRLSRLFILKALSRSFRQAFARGVLAYAQHKNINVYLKPLHKGFWCCSRGKLANWQTGNTYQQSRLTIYIKVTFMYIHVIIIWISTIWVFPKMVVPPKHPKMVIFSRTTKSCWVGYHHFSKPPYQF